MRANCFRFLPVLVFSGFLAATIQSAFADPAGSEPVSTHPQIVRLSYVEGDVRVTRGKIADKQDAAQNGASTGWEEAVKNLPIEAGYSVVTGAGRAEIEFEDASTLCLADNSVMVFTRLSSTGGVPYTELALLSGTATANVHITVVGEWFRVATPTDTLSVSYPRKAVLRIDSYLDAVSITPLFDPFMPKEQLVSAQAKMLGVTTSYSHGTSVLRAARVDATAGVKWDAWVGQRLAARAEAMTTTMKEAGLKSPIPGLAEMKGQGRFFGCAPYGTCWEPTSGWDGKSGNAAEIPVGAASAQTPDSGQSAPAVAGKAAKGVKAYKPSPTQVYLAAHPGATIYTEDFYFPCNTYAVQDVIAIDPATGKEKIIDSYFDTRMYIDTMMYPMRGGLFSSRNGLFKRINAWGPEWDWAICHSGSWIRWNHHYAWVAGANRHYECPVEWVRNGHTVGWVPIHPHDGPGIQPGNLKDGLFKFTGKGPQPYTRVSLEDSKPVKLLGEPPRELRRPEVMHLENAEAPHPLAHSAFETTMAARGPMPSREGPSVRGTVFSAPTAGQNAELRNSEQRNLEVRSSQTRRAETSAAGSPILFDRKSQIFSVERQVNESGRNVTVMQPIGRAGVPERSGPSGYANVGNSSQSYNRGQSYTPSNGNSSNNGSSPSYSATPSYSAPSNANTSNAGSYSAPPAPPPPPPSAPVQSYAPQSSGNSSGPAPANSH